MWLPRRSTVPSLPILVGIDRLLALPRRDSRRLRVRRSGPRTDRCAQVPPPSLGRRRARRADGSPAADRTGRCGHLGADQRPSGAAARLRPGRSDRPGRRPSPRRSLRATVVPNPWRAADRQVTRRPPGRPGIPRPTSAAWSLRAGRRRRGHHGRDAPHGGRGLTVGRCRAGRNGRRRQHPAGPSSHSTKVGDGELNHGRCQGQRRPPTRR